ncbi:MAG: hypothetical protein MJK07_19900 [Flavobacteriales bacterium]|nr:hypothetical protein [Flavobacteriales bacterium]
MRKLMILLIVLVGFHANSQEEIQTMKFENKNSIQVEFGGHGLLYSFGYERILINGNRFKTAAKVSGSYYPPKTGFLEVWLPISVSEIVSFGSHHVELGVGYTFINSSSFTISGEEIREWDGFMTPSLSYRYQKPNGRFMLKAGFTPFIEVSRYTGPTIPGNNLRADFIPSAGLAFGYTF